MDEQPAECSVEERISRRMDVLVPQAVSKSSKCPRVQAETESCSVQWSKFSMLEKAELLAEVPKIVSQDRIQQRTVEQTVDILVPQDVEEPAEFFKTSPPGQSSTAFRRTDHWNPCYLTR